MVSILPLLIISNIILCIVHQTYIDSVVLCDDGEGNNACSQILTSHESLNQKELNNLNTTLQKDIVSYHKANEDHQQ
jgi:hypothetical protein